MPESRLATTPRAPLRAAAPPEAVSARASQETGGSPELIAKAKAAFDEFGVTFLEGTAPEAPAALALLLFGDPEKPMPGGFTHEELSDTSPIKAISAFPQELVLLGRATILIKGIAKRLGLAWPLAQKWKGVAQQALACGEDGCMMPTWTATPLAPPGALVGAGAGAGAGGGSEEERLRFRSVISSYGSSSKLLGQWAAGKVGRVVPTRVKKLAVRVAAKALDD